MKSLIERARQLQDDHSRHEQGGGASEMLGELLNALSDAVRLLEEIRADGIMEEWADDLPARIDALLTRVKT